MEMPKPTADDVEAFKALIIEHPDVTVRPMFGNMAAFVHGNMFAGLFGSALGVKLPDAARREELLTVPGTGPYGPPERPMGGFVALPADWHEQTQLAETWIEEARTQVAKLPPKKPKSKR